MPLQNKISGRQGMLMNDIHAVIPHGEDLLRVPLHNKGTPSTGGERDVVGLRGVLRITHRSHASACASDVRSTTMWRASLEGTAAERSRSSPRADVCRARQGRAAGLAWRQPSASSGDRVSG